MNSTPDRSPHSANYAVMLPCAPEQFQEFITGLLGKPQTISQQMQGSFEMSLADFTTFHHLICQRVNQQNHATLIQMTVQIGFDDGSSVLLNSFDDFSVFHEIRPVVSSRINLSWIFLIQFPDRKFPERQTIDVSFNTNAEAQISYYESEDIFLKVLKSAPGPYVGFRIQHTARTWGADIQSMLENHLNSVLQKDRPERTYIKKHSDKISLFVFFAILITAFWIVFSTGSDLLSRDSKAITSISGETVPVIEKLDFLIKYTSSSLWPKYLLTSSAYLVTAFAFAIVVGFSIDSGANGYRPSFILLSQVAEKERVAALKKYERGWLKFLISIVVSVVAGVFSNILFALYWS